MKHKLVTKTLVALAAIVVSTSAYAGITTGAAGDVSNETLSFTGSSNSGDFGALGVVVDGPSGGNYTVAEKSDVGGLDIDPNAKSLLAFGNSSKFFSWPPYWPPYYPPYDPPGDDCGGVVPEPASIALMGLGLSALAVRRKATRK